MSHTQIQDGKGRGYVTGVNEEGELTTFSQIIKQRDSRALGGSKFFTATGGINVPDTLGTPHPVFGFYNDLSQKVVMSSIFYSWNKATPIQINAGFTPQLASGAATELAVANYDNGNLFAPDITFQKWDGTGSGMTYATSPTFSHFYSLSKENSPYLLEVYNIWSPKTGFSLAVNAEEAGIFTVIFSFFLEDV